MQNSQVDTDQSVLSKNLQLFSADVPKGAEAGGQVQQQLLQAVRQGGDLGNGSAQFVTVLRESCPDISLRHLPVEVAQMILDSRAETMEQFFKSWSESIRENAKLDKQAAKRDRELKQALGQSAGFLVSALDNAVYRGNISLDYANEVRGRIGRQTAIDVPVITEQQSAKVQTRPDQKLPPVEAQAESSMARPENPLTIRLRSAD